MEKAAIKLAILVLAPTTVIATTSASTAAAATIPTTATATAATTTTANPWLPALSATAKRAYHFVIAAVLPI